MTRYRNAPIISAAACAVAIGASPTLADSTNGVFTNITNYHDLPLGDMVADVYARCLGSGISPIPNGPYRRIDGYTVFGTGPMAGGGNARLDYVTWNGSPNAGVASVSLATITTQIGAHPGIPLSAMWTRTSAGGGVTLYTVTDTTAQNSQIVDAGPLVGGMEFIIWVKSGNPKSGTVVCDANVNYIDAFGDVKYGVKDFPADHTVNYMVIGWTGGLSGLDSPAAIDTVCDAYNRAGEAPYRDNDPSNEAMSRPDDDSSDLLLTVSNEGLVVGVGARYARFFGDSPSPRNETSCTSFARACDLSEDESAANSCNPEGGGSTPSQVEATNGKDGNDSICLSGTGTGSFYQICWPGNPTNDPGCP